MKQILIGDATEMLATLDAGSVHCCVTSPPYFGLRDYGVAGQIGLEESIGAYVERLASVFREVKRVLRDDGTLWLNLGDSYASFRDGKATPDTTRGDCIGTLVPKGSARNRMRSTFAGTGVKHKDLLGVPWRVAFALQADGWILRQDIIWAKPNPMPESVKDRCVKAHEYLFLFSKSPRYYFTTIKEPAACAGQKRGGSKRRYSQNDATCDSRIYDTRTKRSVWWVQPAKKQRGTVKHFATFPPDLVTPCIAASTPLGGTVLDPFAGSGTVGRVANSLGRASILIDLNPAYRELMEAS